MWRGGDGLEVERVPATVRWSRRQAAVRRRQHAGTDRASRSWSSHRLLCTDHLHSCILLLCPATMWKAHLLCTLHPLLMLLPRHADPLVQRRRSWSQVSEPHLCKHCDHTFVLHICHCLFCSWLLAVVFENAMGRGLLHFSFRKLMEVCVACHVFGDSLHDIWYCKSKWFSLLLAAGVRVGDIIFLHHHLA